MDKIHSLPFLPAIEWTFIYIPILYHTFYGIWIIATGQPNVERYGYAKNWFYVLQRASAIVLVLFIVFHIFAMKGVFGGDVGRALTFAPVNYATAEHGPAHERRLVGVGHRLPDRDPGQLLPHGQRVLDGRHQLGADRQRPVDAAVGLRLHRHLLVHAGLRRDGLRVAGAHGHAAASRSRP